MYAPLLQHQAGQLMRSTNHLVRISMNQLRSLATVMKEAKGGAAQILTNSVKNVTSFAHCLAGARSLVIKEYGANALLGAVKVEGANLFYGLFSFEQLSLFLVRSCEFEVRPFVDSNRP